MKLRYYTPLELIEQHNAARAEMAPREFFCSKQQKARERYCAALFSATYESARAPCRVALQEPDPQDDVDFYLEVHAVLHEFQLTEVQEPGRRRGDEYKEFKAGKVIPQAWQEAHEHGPEWIEAAISKKLKDYAGRVATMNLLVYVNFPAYELGYQTVKDFAAQVAAPFASVWLMTGNAIGCIKANPELGNCDAWLNAAAVTEAK